MSPSYSNIFRDMSNSSIGCTCSSDFWGFGAYRDQLEVRAFYGDAAYEFMFKESAKRAEAERTRLALIRRGDFIDDVAWQLQTNN